MKKVLEIHNLPELLEKLFMDKLPGNVRKTVVASPAHSLELLAQQADRVMAVDASSLYNLTSQSRTLTESADLV